MKTTSAYMYVVTEFHEIGTCFVLRSKYVHANVKQSFFRKKDSHLAGSLKNYCDCEFVAQTMQKKNYNVIDLKKKNNNNQWRIQDSPRWGRQHTILP